MSNEDNPFRFVPSLQHMAIVKTSETLLRDSKLKEIMESIVLDIDYCKYYDTDVSKLDSMIEKLEEIVNLLPVPKLLKINLKSFLLSMIESAKHWLIVTTRGPRELYEQYWKEEMSDLMNNLQWNNFGEVDGWKTLQSYVSNRETINFLIWNQLCFHCMEDDIIRFSNTIDWNYCQNYLNSIISVYWYHKIYGKFPTVEMYQRRFHDYLNSHDDYEHMLDEKEILRTMLGTKEMEYTTPAMMYFQNCLKDGEYDELVAELKSFNAPNSNLFYCLRTFKKDSLLNIISRHRVVNYLMSLPLILFIDDWINVFEIIDAESFSEFFLCIGSNWTQTRNDRHKMFYEPFEKMWPTYYRRFALDGESIGRAFYRIFDKDDIILCEIMFKELDDHQRLVFMEQVKNYVGSEIWKILNNKVAVEFPEHVLKNDEERKLFSEIRLKPALLLWEII